MWSRQAKLLAACGALAASSGAMTGVAGLELSGLAILALLTAEWILFRWRVEVAGRRDLRLERELSGPSGQDVAWIGEEVEVRLRLTNAGGAMFPYLEIRDVVPAHMQALGQEEDWVARLEARQSVEWSYQARTVRVGRASFPGVSVTLVSRGGLFFDNLFIEARKDVSIFPPVFGRESRAGFQKRYNQFRQHGIHFHRRSGLGSELLELRDYVPGDQPQSVAWRASARRENLVVRDFESEVPIRITVFLDASASMRAGTKERTPLDDAIRLVAEFSKLALEERDRVGVTVVTETGESVLLPGRGRSHLRRILQHLNSHANLSAGQGVGDFEGLFEAVDRYAHVRYPDLWGRGINDYSTLWHGRLRWPWIVRREARRKRLATVLCSALGEGPVRLQECVESEGKMARLMTRFVEAEQLWVGRASPEAVLELCDAGASKLDVLERNLRHAVRRAKDNEFFLLMMNFAMLEDRLDAVIDAAVQARSRHHRVLVFSPWITSHFGTVDASADVAGVLRKLENASSNLESDRLRRELIRARYAESMESVRMKFLKAGLPVALVRQEDTLGYLLSQVDRLRTLEGVRR
jgi:uncharacterized protein (DUF58 family)